MSQRSTKPLVAGNWKMNGVGQSLGLARTVVKQIDKSPPGCEVMICPPATLLFKMNAFAKASALMLGGQDCHASPQGAHTGDIAAEMLKDAGASAVIVGHSERREQHGESDAAVRAKGEAAHRAGLVAIICLGETLEQRKDRQTLPIVGQQLKGSLPASSTRSNTIIAYEPVWAIGTGLTPGLGDVSEVHSYLRNRLGSYIGDDQAKGVRLLYGGSVKPDNARELLSLENVDGALVGGASLQAEDFLQIIRVYS